MVYRFQVLFLLVLGWLFTSASAQPVHLTGSFDRTAALLDSEHKPAALGSTLVWDSSQGNGLTGTFSCGPFRADSAIELWVNGFPAEPDEQIVLQRASDGLRLRLLTRGPPGGVWTRYRWSLPKDWRGEDVTLSAADSSSAPNQWLGISQPLPLSSDLFSALRQVALQLSVSVLLLLPGLAGLTLLRPLPARWGLAVTMALSGVLSYGLFFAYYLRPAVGNFGSWAVLIGAVCVLGVRRRRAAQMLADAEFSWPLVFSGLAAALYFIIGYAYGGHESPDAVALFRFLPNQPPDPLLPHWLAQRVANGQPVRPFFLDWLSSDRPPLQTGFNLLLWPLFSGSLAYEALGVAAQSWVWLGLWIFLRSLAVSRRTTGWVFAAALLSGFFLKYSIYCSPKLLPTGFLLTACGLLFDPDPAPAKDRTMRAVLIGASLGLAMLGHGGSAFGLGAIIVTYFLVRGGVRCPQRAQARVEAAARRFRAQPSGEPPLLQRIPPVLIGAAVFLALMAPWQAYQHWADPPGDRLIKYHLANHPEIDPRGSLTVIAEAYRQHRFKDLLKIKLGSFAYPLAGWTEWSGAWRQAIVLAAEGHFTSAGRIFATTMRRVEDIYYGLALGPLLLALTGFVPGVGRAPTASERTTARLVGLLTLAHYTVWSLLMWGWRATAIIASSFLLGATWIALAGLGLARCRPNWRWTILGLQALWFGGIWVVAEQREPGVSGYFPSAFPGYVWVGIILAGLTVRWLARLGGTCPPGALSAPSEF